MKSSRPLRQGSFGFCVIVLIVVLFGTLFLSRTSFMQGVAPQRQVTRQTDGTLRTQRFRKAAPSETGSSSAVNEASSVASPNAVALAGNYVFSDASNASLTDMSSGTTQLIGPDQDDRTSQVTALGFDFYFDGVRQDRFSVSSNGSLRFGALAVGDAMMQPLGSFDQSLITAYGADQRTHIIDGKVHFKVTGTAPNRVLGGRMAQHAGGLPWGRHSGPDLSVASFRDHRVH
jgi:hypothetical protein